MCGLAGFVDLERPADEAARATLAGMARALERRGPDDAGQWYTRSTGLGFAFQRLAIHDLSPLGHQPMLSADGRWVLVFNGEIYNYKALRSELAARGVEFRSQSDSEALLAAVALWGVDATLPRLAGMFAFAIYDRRERTLWLARDRAGEKPLVYGWSGRAFLFGSTVTALERHPRFRSDLSGEAVAALLKWKCIPAPLSIYERIAKLPPGSRLRLPLADEPTEPEIVRYWHLPEPGADASPATLEEVESVLEHVVSEQVSSDRPLGAFLSGGIDSSTIVTLMSRVADRRVKTFTVGFDDPRFDETAYAERVAAALGTEHRSFSLRADEALAFVPELNDCYDEPFADASELPTLLVSRAAREEVVVALSGDGGDEVFGGYTRYRETLAAWRALARYPLALRRAAGRCLSGAAHTGVDAWLTPLLELGKLRKKGRSAASALRYWGDYLATPSLGALYARKLSTWRDVETVVGDALAASLASGAEPQSFSERPGLRALMARDFVGYLPNDVLVKVDRASMFFGLEVRAPLLDHRVVEVAWRVPERDLDRDGAGKYPLRALLARRLPNVPLERPKRGFAVPLGAWLRGPLREWAESLLTPAALAEAGLAPAPIRERWRLHLGEIWDNSEHIWAVLMLMNWRSGRQAEREPRARAALV